MFAGVIMIMGGILQAIAGLAALLQDEFFVVTKNYSFDVDTTTWGWIIPYYPFWAILIIALDMWVMWALTRSVSKAEEMTA